MKASRIAFLALLSSATVFANEIQKAELTEVVISASGFEQSADSNLRNVLVINADELNKRAYTSLEQALERISGVSFVNFGLGRNIDLRGQGDKSNVAVKVMIDGRSINVLDNSHGVTPLNSINLDDVERIEIIPGGGSVLYGNGTRGGVINIITKKRKSDNYSLALKGGGYDKKGVFGDVNARVDKYINDNVSLNFSLNGFNKQGYQEGYSQKGFFGDAKALFSLGDDTDMNLNFSYFQSKNTSSGYLTKEQIENNPRQKGSSENITKITRPEFSLDLNHKFSDFFELNLLAYHQQQKIEYLKDRLPYTMQGMTVTAYQDGSGFEDALSGANLKTKFNYMDKSYFILGYDFAYHDAKRLSIVHYSVPVIIPYHTMTTDLDMNKQSHSIFFLENHSFNDYFSISGGARMEYARYTGDRVYRNQMSMNIPPFPPNPTITDTTTTFKIDDKSTTNYAFEITPNFSYSDTGSIYAKFESSFVSPTPAQLVSRDQNLGYYTSNLNPEKYNTFEIGIKDFWWDFHQWQVSLFYTQSKDEISYLGDPHAIGGSFWHYYNISQTRRFGAEINLNQSFLDDSIRTYQSLSYIDAKITDGINDGKLIPYVSRVKTTAGLEYAFNKNFSSFIDLTYFSRAKDSGVINANTGKMVANAWIKDYFLTDIGFSYNYKGISLLAGIKNLFDKHYYTYQNSSANQYLAGDGRSYYLSLRYTY